ncbi:tetratricopeptide repeat protein [Fodinibius saliphilus]|uniref:tetratricopeptide repeat protein n=1 Tax=Fodinibius saliphilus TaxID=1920650 RepID=UPI0011098E9B|nr:tetratricopeptide repeat protein [Fodinibius saliphilus]
MLHKRVTLCLLLFVFVFTVIPLQAQEIQSPDTENYQQGITLFDKGLYEEAIEELNHFIANHSQHSLQASAGFYLARAKSKIDSVNTLSYYETYIDRYPYSLFSSKLLFEMAQRAEEQKKYNEAIHFYDRAVQLGLNNKNAPRTYYWMGEAAAANNDNSQARAYFLTLADKYPDSDWAPKALYSRGRLYLSENKYDSSTVAFELLKERYPRDEMTRRIGTALGESYYQQGRYQEAIEAFKNAIPHLDEERETKAVLLIAESYNYLNQFDNASTYYKQYINRTKGTDKVRAAHYGLGWVYHKQEIYHWAAEEFGKAAKGNDELARKGLYYKAVNEKLGSRYREAIETFRSFGERFEKGLWVEEAYYEWAITAYEVGRYSEAIEVLLPLVRSDGKLEWKGKVYTLLGEAYFANQEYTRAIQAFNEAEKVTDVSPVVKRQAQFQKAWVQYSNQAYKQAQPVFQSINEKYPESKLGKEALFWSADAYYHLDDYGPASAQFAKFIQRYPNHKLVGPANYSLGWSYFKMGSYEKAIEPFVRFKNKYEAPEVALYPYDTDTQLRVGDSYYAISDYENAIQYYQQAIGAEPGGDYAMFQIANSHYRNEQTYEAVTTFRRFLRIYPYSRLREQAQYNIAYIYLNTGNYTQAVEEFQTVINKYPNTSWAARSQYNIGDTYYNAGEYEKAIDAYKKVMEKYPRSEYIIEAVNGIQYAQMSSGKADSSSAVLEDFLAEHPQTSMADRLRFRQADNRMQTGDYRGAIKEFQQYLRITNNRELQPDAHFNLANAYEQTNKVEKAVQEYRTIVSDFPNSERAAPSLASLGRIAYSQGNYQESVDYFEQLAKEGSQYRQEALIGMGNAQLVMNNIDQAGKHYQVALNNNPEYAPAKVGMAKVALQKENYEQAKDLLSLVAESNTTEVGAEAQYLLGRVNHLQKSYEAAIKAYSNVNVLYQAFDGWVAKSLLGKAKCYIQLGQRGEARSALQKLVEDYPDTPQSQEAQRLLDRS